MPWKPKPLSRTSLPRLVHIPSLDFRKGGYIGHCRPEHARSYVNLFIAELISRGAIQHDGGNGTSVVDVAECQHAAVGACGSLN
jgi:hypothetical protein